MKKINKNKKSQQEIIGFVLIIVLVSVVGVIFLGLSLSRGETDRKTSVTVANLLEASSYYTTECVVGFVPQYKSGQELIKSCWEDDRCLDGRTACEVLNTTLKYIIQQGLEICEDKNECQNKAYKVYIYYSPLNEELPNEEILKFQEGIFEKCSNSYGGSHSIPLTTLDSGTLNIELEVCGS
ncbi:MAG: hypothetical protein WCX73_01215 [Candidatus Pacearchaeota archaeon]|jgi:hypothetical protein